MRSGAILQNSPPTTNASGTGYEVVNEPASQERGSFSTSYPSNALIAQITSFGKMADSLIEHNRFLQEKRSKKPDLNGGKLPSEIETRS